MKSVLNKIAGFFKEAWRRNVFHIVIPYSVVSWGLVQIADTVLFGPAFDTPPWVFKALLLVLAVGFPIAIIIAWVFDITPKGLVRTDNQDKLLEAKEEAEPPPEPALALALGDSERRRVTMLSCIFQFESIDGEEIDPEELANLLTGIESISQAVVEQYDGYRVPGQPEELTILFGYPHAHDDDARRAVAAGLAALERISGTSSKKN